LNSRQFRILLFESLGECCVLLGFWFPDRFANLSLYGPPTFCTTAPSMGSFAAWFVRSLTQMLISSPPTYKRECLFLVIFLLQLLPSLHMFVTAPGSLSICLKHLLLLVKPFTTSSSPPIYSNTFFLFPLSFSQHLLYYSPIFVITSANVRRHQTTWPLPQRVILEALQNRMLQSLQRRKHPSAPYTMLRLDS
jgi:hypothetical protein